MNSSPLFIFVQSVFGLIDFAIFICSVVGNSVVIYVISRDKKLKSKSNYHILSVAFADLTIGLLGIPLGVVAVSALRLSIKETNFEFSFSSNRV
jgi:7 transmembrane receptor (rhodopsin family)